MNNPKQTPSYPLDLGGPGKCIQRKKPMVSKKLKSQDPCFVFLHALTIPFPGLHSWMEFPHLSMVALTYHLGRLRQGAQEFRVSLEYRTNLKPALVTWNLDFKMNLFSKTTVKTCRPFVSDELCFVLFCYRLFPHFIDKRRSPLWNRLLPVFG